MTKSFLVFVAGSHLLTCLLLILQAENGGTAPAPSTTHHLTIAVEGDSPTLVVTSSEIGITPEKLSQTITTTTTTTTVVAPTQTVPTKNYKNFAQKPKSKSTKYTKKQKQYSAKEKTIWRGKDILTISSTPTTTTTAPTTPLNKELTASITSSVAPNSGMVSATKTSTAAIDAGADNQYGTAVIPEALPNAPQEERTSEKPSETQTTFGNLPHETQTVTTVTVAPTAPTDAEQTLVVVTSAKTVDDDDDDDNDTTVLTTAISVDSTASEEQTPAPVIATEVLPVSEETTTTTKSAYIKSNYGDDDNIVVVTHQPGTAPAAAATTHVSVLTVQSKGSQREVTVTETSDLTDASTTTVVITDNTQEPETSSAPPPPPTTTVVVESPTTKASEQHQQPHYDGIIKLIDLEGHNLKSIDEVQEQQTHSNRPPHTDDGHDGVKVTKKKQLIDRHFSADSITAGAITTTTTTDSSSIATPTVSKTDDKKVSVPHSQNVEKPTKPQPTLMPVHNGYLGPIFMEEKTFSVVHHAHPKQHEPSIESQLRDGRIVEILAPTALVEQTPATSTTMNDESFVTTTTIPPTVRRTATQLNVHNTPVLSTTVFQVSESLTSTTRLPANTKFTHKTNEAAVATKLFVAQGPDNSQQTESKISDIQIEVYDSTVDSIVASTNFKDTDGYYSPPLEPAVVGTVKPALSAVTQERFTQYVIDRTDSSTQESSIAPLHIASGKPEPAAIEIHINVSEGFGNASEDLEFSYRQSDYTANSRPNWVNNFASKSSKPNYMKTAQNESNATGSSERSDEVLVVEIIDTGDNSTENVASSENVNPIFTFRSDIDSDVELKDIKYFPPETMVKPPQVSDELFMVDVKKGEENFPQPPPPPPPPPRQPSIDRDSDTIFYISNTEVKVGESLPTANTNYEQQQQLRKTRLENQFFPASYMASTHPNSAKIMEPAQHRYEEDIILSPLSNTADSLKIFRSAAADGAPPLDVTYVGESVMEVEQLSSASGGGGGGVAAGIATTFTSTAYAALPPSQTPDVIIQPAILPEMSIGVPVIGELPPQIELKEIDFMPDEANQQRSGVYENDIEENVNANDVDRLVESSIQYGGDLIDEGAGGVGFDGVEGSYPFGNPVAMRRKQQHGGSGADYAHFTSNHGVSNLRKDELSVDMATSGGSSAEAGALAAENSTLKELLQNRYGNDTSMNISYSVSERMGNATAFSVMEDPSAAGDGELGFKNLYTLIIGLFIVLLPVVVTVSMACALRYLYSKYQASSSDNNDNTDPHQANGTAGDGGEQGESTQPPSPTKSALDKETATTPTTKRYENDKTSNDIIPKPSNSSSHCSLTDEKLSFQPTQNPFNEPAFVYKCDTKSMRQTDDQSNSVQGNCKYAGGGPNGSVTKMTLKNNHLIVETEERNDISRDARETKMHYNTSDKDGIFVVEVARGADSKAVPDSPIAMAAELPIYETKQNGVTILKTEDEKVLKNHEEVQIHQPPPELPNSSTAEELQRSLHQIVEVEEPTPSPNSAAVQRNGTNDETGLNHNSNTGLSQSDLSSTSSTDSNKRYSYGNQELYIIEQSGYATISPTANMPLIVPSSDETQDDDRKSENGHSLEHSPSQQQSNAAKEDNCSKLSKDNKDQKMPTNTNANRDECQLNGYVAADNKEDDELDIEEVIEQTTIETEEAVKVIPDVVLNQPPAETTTTEAVEAADAIDTKPPVIEQQTTSLGVELELKPVENDSMNGVEAEEGQQQPQQQQHQHNNDTLNGIETESENAYDSIMSLPDPPSNEEIKQLSDFSLIETNQLDSLPPPPPPPLATCPTTTTTTAVNGIIEEIKPAAPLTKLLALAEEVQPALLTNGIDTPKSNGHEISYNTSTLPPPPPSPTPSTKGITSNGEVLTAQLTPPASPPPHFSNGVVLNGGGMCVPPLPMAVDVNGS